MARGMIKFCVLVVFVLTAALFAGCGSDNREGVTAADVAKVDESACAQCHSTAIDHIAGTPIYEAYLASSHFTNNFRLVDCQDCHGGGSQHNGVGPLPFPNPDSAGKCFECHQNHLPAAHFRNYTAAAHPAQYVTSNYQKSCTSCHDPHKGNKGIGQEHKDWAESGHGNVNAEAWKHYDFKNYKAGESYTCLRCHTSTGFINYVNANFTNPFPKATWAASGDNSREVLTCKGCHTDYNFKNRVRRAAAYTAHYGFTGEQASVAYDDAATSNLCIPCHTGMINEAAIEAVSDFTKASFSGINPHYLAAAGILYGKVGFKYYADPTKYVSEFVSTHFAHNNIGINDYKLPLGPIFKSTGFNGPCVSCHMPNGTHTLGVAAGYTDQTNGICTKCHIVGTGYEMTAAKIEEEKEGYLASLALFQEVLRINGMSYTEGYPYFGTTNWTTVGPTTNGRLNMGAAFNYSLLKHEPGAFTHNRVYAKRLMFDSIDYLQHGAVTGSINFTSYSSATVPVSKARTYLGAVRP